MLKSIMVTIKTLANGENHIFKRTIVKKCIELKSIKAQKEMVILGVSRFIW